MAQDLEQKPQNIFQRINSISIITVTNDEGRTIFFIPVWTMIVGIVLLVVMIRSRRSHRDVED